MVDCTSRSRRARIVVLVFTVVLISFVFPGLDSVASHSVLQKSNFRSDLDNAAKAAHAAQEHFRKSRGNTGNAANNPFLWISNGAIPNKPCIFELRRPLAFVNSTVQLVEINESTGTRHLTIGSPMIWQRRFTAFATHLACQQPEIHLSSLANVNFAQLVECGYCMFRLDGEGLDDLDAHWMAYPRCGRFIGTSDLNQSDCDEEIHRPLKWICELHAHEKKVYSQHGEDGVLLQILRMSHMYGALPDGTKRRFVEFGAEDGSECNTRILREHAEISQYWTGFLMDGGNENLEINLFKEYFSPENIAELFVKHGLDPSDSIDVLVIDTDLYDYYILKAIFVAGWLPKIIVAEFNSRLGPKVSWTVPRQSNLDFWDETDFFGASLHAQAKLSELYGYVLVHVDSAGVNAFYLHHSLLQTEGDVPYTSLEDWISIFWRPPAYASAPKIRYDLQLDQTTSSSALPSERLNGKCVAPYSTFSNSCFGHNDDGLMRSFVEV